MLVKSAKATGTFKVLRKNQVKLNPVKCAFGVSFKKFLGFMVSQREIEANSKKIQVIFMASEEIQVILNMKSPRTTKEIQRLTGRVAALNRFEARAIEKCKVFFKILKKEFKWTLDGEEAFN